MPEFDCTACRDEVTFYSMVYSFQLVAGPDLPCCESHLRVVRSENRVTLIGEPRVVDPYFATFRVHSQGVFICGNAGAIGRVWTSISTRFVPRSA
jgi:hypothetical protein